MGAQESKAMAAGSPPQFSRAAPRIPEMPSSPQTPRSPQYFDAAVIASPDKPLFDESPNPLFFEKERLTDPEAIKKNVEFREKVKNSEMFQRLLKVERKTREKFKDAQKDFLNELPWDKNYWKKIPSVKLPNGLVLPRHQESKSTALHKYYEVLQQFLFGLWGFRQRPYPGEKPFNFQGVYSIKGLEDRNYDYIMRSGGFYYKDRLGRTRGPMEVITMKTAFAAGVIDRNTLVWGDDMDEWVPVGHVYGLEKAIATPDARLAASMIHIVQSLTLGLNPMAPKKGHELDTLEKLQKAGEEKREREKNILRNYGGLWPGDSAPGHVLGLWAGGSQLSEWLDGSKTTMPDKFVPYRMRKKLAEVIPGLRPWEVLEVEQIWDLVTFHKDFYRSNLGTFTGQLDYLKPLGKDFRDIYKDSFITFGKILKAKKKVKDVEKNLDKATKEWMLEKWWIP